jgi:hypothetical protein
VTAAKTDRFGWLLYDFANNSFSVGAVSRSMIALMVKPSPGSIAWS